MFTIYVPLISDEEAMPKRLVDVSPQGHERVAVIDDDPGVLFVVKTFLERLGYQTTHFQSAKAFLDALDVRHQAFDVVVTDLSMPEMSGIQLVRHLAEHHPTLPVILTSGFDEPLQSISGTPCSVQAVLRKPYGAVDVGRAIRRVVTSASRMPTSQER
jgi:DNA-binding NtrC family response regulator